MTTAYKPLGQVNPAAVTLTDLYTVPADLQSIASTLSICNTGISSTVRVAVRPAGAAINIKHYLAYDAVVNAGDTLLLTIGLTLAKTDVVTVYAGHANMAFSLFGLEMDAPAVTAPTWKRNASWTALPSVTGLEKFAGLVAVFPDSNFLALSAAGNYTVDWGDGSATENISSGVQANHQFDYTTYDTSKATMGPVTFTDTGDLIGRTAHGYVNGDVVQFWNIVSTTGLVQAASYYVINALTNSFQVSDSLGGAAKTLTTDGTGTLLQYKQCVVTVVPNGGTLTNVNLQKRHTQALLQMYDAGWLDIVLEGANLTTLAISASSQVVGLSLLNQVALSGANLIVDFSYMFYDCYALQSVPLLNTSSGTNLSSMFSGCYLLQSVPLFDTSSGTNFSYMFSNCYALQSVPLLNTSSGTNFSYMFYGCSALQSVPLLNTSSGTNLSSMFDGCSALQSVPLFDTALNTDFSYMFGNCSALQSVPLLNTSSGTNLSSMFDGCYLLQSVPLFDTALNTDFSYMFGNCYALQSVPLLNTSSGTYLSSMFNGCHALRTIPLFDTALNTDFSYMFYGCSALESVPLLNTSLVTEFSLMFNNCYALQTIPLFDTALGQNFSYMFSSCYSLQTIPLLNTSSGTDFTYMFGYCYSLQAGAFSGTKFDISYDSCKLSGAALDDIYTNLASGVSGVTITVTNNWGNTSDTPSIATAKGWTVVG